MRTGEIDRGLTAELLEGLLEECWGGEITEMAKSNLLDSTSDTDIYCPFYKGTENRQVIRCEGPYEKTAVRLGFAGKKKCQSFMDVYCKTQDCNKCRIYQCIMKKYDGA